MRTAVIICLMTLLAACFGKSPESQRTDLQGKKLPAFTLQLQDSSTFINTADIPAGKPFAIFYYSPVCPYCKAQTAEIIDHIKELKDIQFYFVTSFPYEYMKQYSKHYELNKFPNITTARDTSGSIGSYFNLPGVPVMVIYSKNKLFNKAYLGNIKTRDILKASAL